MNLINKKNMEENMNDMHGEETPRTDLTLFSEKMQELKSRIASVIVGQERTVDLVLTAILANGHVLIEGVPGVAKTLLARLTARLIDEMCIRDRSEKVRYAAKWSQLPQCN